VLGVLLEVSEAGEEIDSEIHATRTDRQLAHVRAHQRGSGYLAGQTQQGHRQIDSGAPGTGRVKSPRMAPCPTGYVEHPPPLLKGHGSDDEIDGPPSLGVVPMRIEPQVLFAEPFFEPFHGGHWLLAIGYWRCAMGLSHRAQIP